MRLSSLLLAALAFAAPVLPQQWPVHDSGLTDAVQWDHYSLIVNGERLFLWSGELHYWRIPVPAVWQEILEKIKAAGFNAISVYGHWAYHSASEDHLDFESGGHNPNPIFDIAKDLGLYILARPGPYVNAETTAGGLALWVRSGAYGGLRNNDTRYQQAWTPYMTAYNQLLAKHQITEGGNVIAIQIENEIESQRRSDGSLNLPLAEYMVALEKNARDNGIVIPLFTNAPNPRSRSWSKDYLPAAGAQDMYGLDSYPSCWSCNLKECGNVPEFQVVAYHEHFDLVSPTQPSFIPEFQGGAYNPWGGVQGGCPLQLGPDFVNVFYRHNLAERVTMVNLYMLFGGTNWGGLATNLVGTSYDYNSPISETRQISEKYYETKLLGLFLRVADDLRKTDRVASGTNYTTATNVLATELRNPDTNAAFYITRHSNSASTELTTFKLNILSSRGALTIPRYSNDITLDGRESKLLATDFPFGSKTLLYSTAEILSYSVVDGSPIIALWLPAGEFGEFALKGGSRKHTILSSPRGRAQPTFHVDVNSDLVVAYQQWPEQTIIQFDGFKAILLSRDSAFRFWAPSLSKDPLVPVNQTIFVTGPYLVRGVKAVGPILSLTGDIDADTNIEIWAPKRAQVVKWNNKLVRSTRTPQGSLLVHLPKPSFAVDDLRLDFGTWKYRDGLPERHPAYDDSRWVVADHSTTPNPTKPATLPVLYSDDYGFHTGYHIWRGYFSGNATAVRLVVQGGTASGWSAWLNGDYVGSFVGNASAAAGDLTLPFTNATVRDANVLVVLQDHSGHNQRAEALFPRGILQASLEGADVSFSKWTLAGNAGGEANIDPIRGNIAEGALERLGWHLPGFDDSEWESRTPSEGVSTAGVGFFRTTLNFDIPKGHDVPLQLEISSPTGSLLRAQLYVNGYNYGKYIPQVGHQIHFPIPPGIVNLNGKNTVGLILWAQTREGAQVQMKWAANGVYESSWSAAFDASELQPGWTAERLQYV